MPQKYLKNQLAKSKDREPGSLILLNVEIYYYYNKKIMKG